MSEIVFRDLTEEDFGHVSKAIYRVWNKTKKHKEWVDQAWNDQEDHPDFYTRHLYEISYLHKVVVNEAYLILYTSGSPWYDPTKVMLEPYLVLRIKPGSNFNDLCEALDILATKNECDHICVGTAFTGLDESLIKRYCDNGYTKFETILHKKIRR